MTCLCSMLFRWPYWRADSLERWGDIILNIMNPDARAIPVMERSVAGWSLQSFTSLICILIVYLSYTLLVPMHRKRKDRSSFMTSQALGRDIRPRSERPFKSQPAPHSSSCTGFTEAVEDSDDTSTASTRSASPISSQNSPSDTQTVLLTPPRTEPSIPGSALRTSHPCRDPVLTLQKLYDCFQVLASAYVGWLGIAAISSSHPNCPYVVWCKSGTFNVAHPSPDALKAWHAFYWLKVVDLADTVFIVQRRKWQQLSFLHVYHHASMLVFCWILLNVAVADDILIGQVCNCGVHVLMYLYYLVRASGFTVPKPLKAALTATQMTQFILLTSHSIIGLLLALRWVHFPRLADRHWTDVIGSIGGPGSHWEQLPACPARIMLLESVYQIVMYLLFREFAKKTYARRGEAKQPQGKACDGLKESECIDLRDEAKSGKLSKEKAA